jgi:hypothetical protein
MKIKVGDMMRYQNVKRGIDAICLIIAETTASEFNRYYDVQWVSGVNTEELITESVYIDFTTQFGKWEKLS